MVNIYNTIKKTLLKLFFLENYLKENNFKVIYVISLQNCNTEVGCFAWIARM